MMVLLTLPMTRLGLDMFVTKLAGRIHATRVLVLASII